MTPTHTRKGATKYRYYVSWALVQGQSEQAGSISRIPAPEIEALVTKSVRDQLGLSADLDDKALVQNHVTRVDLRPDRLVIELAEMKGAKAKRRPARSGSRCHGARHHLLADARFCCPRPRPLIPRARSGQRTAHSLLLQLPKDDGG